MIDDLIPADVQQFIIKSIDSIAQMEALVLLCVSPDESWNTSALAGRLYVSEQEATSLLAHLQAEGLVVAENEPVMYRYQPSTTESAELVKRVVEIYSRHLVPVTNLIHSKPKTRIQQFADAFKLRKDE